MFETGFLIYNYSNLFLFSLRGGIVSTTYIFIIFPHVINISKVEFFNGM